MDPTKIITLTILKRPDGVHVCSATSLYVDVPPGNKRIRTSPSESRIINYTLENADLPAEHWEQIKKHAKTAPGTNNDGLVQWILVYDPSSQKWKDILD